MTEAQKKAVWPELDKAVIQMVREKIGKMSPELELHKKILECHSVRDMLILIRECGIPVRSVTQEESFELSKTGRHILPSTIVDLFS